MADRTCSVEGCERPYDSKGYCQMHATRVRRYGSPQAIKRVVVRGTPEERFWVRVNKTADSCWEWTGARHPLGYGNFNAGMRSDGTVRYIAAHRFSWELTHGPIPEGHEVCHACDNPPCVRPDHLWLGTHLDNMRDMDTKGRCDRWGNRKPR